MNKNLNELMARQRELNDALGGLNNTIQTRELNDDEKAEMDRLNVEFENNKREIGLLIQEKEAAAVIAKPSKDVNTELREFFRNSKPGDKYVIPMNRGSISYASQGSASYPGTAPYVQGLTVVDLIPTDRPDNDILLTAGVPMTTGVTGNKIQWAFAGGVEAAFANELANTTERTIDLDKQNPIQQRLTVRVRISNQALENSNYDLQSYIVTAVADSIRKKVNFALSSTSKATAVFYGPFAQGTESGTYGTDGYTAGKQVGTFINFTYETAAEMIGKIAKRNIDLDTAVFVMGAADFWELKATPKDAGSGLMMISDDNRLLGIPVVVNNAINKSTENGAASGHNIGLGIFKYVPVMQHGNIRLTVDGTSAYVSNTDEVFVTINTDFSMTILENGKDAFVLYGKDAAYSGDDSI